MTTFANPTTAPAGTRVYTVRGGFGADGTRDYATVTGYFGKNDTGIAVVYDNGSTTAGPVAHKAYIVDEDEQLEDVDVDEPTATRHRTGRVYRVLPLEPDDELSAAAADAAREIGEDIAARMRAARLTMSDAAPALGITRDTLRRRLSGGELRVDDVVMLGYLLGCTVEIRLVPPTDPASAVVNPADGARGLIVSAVA